MKKWKIVEKLLDDQERIKEWIDSIPSDIREAFFDNPVVNTLGESNDMLLRSFFHEYEYNEINWLLHEWLNNRNLTASMDGVEYKMKTICDAVEFYKKFHPEGE
jgi:hypothetical protein